MAGISRAVSLKAAVVSYESALQQAARERADDLHEALAENDESMRLATAAHEEALRSEVGLADSGRDATAGGTGTPEVAGGPEPDVHPQAKKAAEPA